MISLLLTRLPQKFEGKCQFLGRLFLNPAMENSELPLLRNAICTTILVIPNSKISLSLTIWGLFSFWVKNHCPYGKWLLGLFSGEHKALKKHLCYLLWDSCYYSLELTLKPYTSTSLSNHSQIFYSSYQMATPFSSFFNLHVSIISLKAHEVQACLCFNNFQLRFTFWLVTWHSFLSSSWCFLQVLCLFLAAFSR